MSLRNGRRRRVLPAVGVLVTLVLVERGIADQNVSCSASMSWMNNVDGESPCTVANNLMLPCSGSSAFQISPLNGSSTSYTNPLPGQSCSCNTVVYNLLSACAVCQAGAVPSLSLWMDGCSSVSYAAYSNKALAESYSTPQWAYVNVTSEGFDLAAVEKAAGVDDDEGSKRGWSPIQIVLPIIVAIIVALGAGLFFILYRRRIKARYTKLSDARRPELARHSSTSSSTLGLDRLFSGVKRKPTTSRVAWEPANLPRPRRLGGLFSDRRAVHPRTRGADWSIDSDIGPLDDNNTISGENTSPGAGDGRASIKEAAVLGAIRHGHASSASLASRISTSALNLLSNVGLGTGTAATAGTSGPATPALGVVGEKGASQVFHPPPDVPLLPIQDAPAAALNSSARSKPGVARGGQTLPAVHVAAGGPRARGFNLDDVNSARSPTVVANEHGREASSVAEIVDATTSAVIEGRTAAAAQAVAASGSRSGAAGWPDENVVLISRTPGQDFNSLASPVETDGVGEFHTSSSEYDALSAALSDASSVLPDSLSLSPLSGAFPHPPVYAQQPPPLPSSAPRRPTPLQSSPLAAPAPAAIPRLLVAVPPQHADPSLLAPSVIRAAGGYTPSPPPARSLAPPVAYVQPNTAAGAQALSPFSGTRTDHSGSIPLLPNAGLFGGTDAMSPASGFSWGYNALSPSAVGPTSAAVTDISHASQNSSTAATAAWSNSSQAPTSASVESTAGAVAMLAPRVGTVPGSTVPPMTFAPPSIRSFAPSSASVITPSSFAPPSTHSSDQYTVPNPFTFSLPRGPGGATVQNPLYVAFQKQQQEEQHRHTIGTSAGVVTGAGSGPELGSNNPFVTRPRTRSASFDLDA